MSLTVHQLTKQYGRQLAVDTISFSVRPGEILGFLGPNGAGKSTTMKIATGFLPPSSGSVRICDYDVTEHPRKVKERIGYLPEHNPLYLDLFVHEYLHFIGKLHGLKNPDRPRRVSHVIERCGLGPEQNKKIEKLSKGYRQRVGLAQALLHDPEVLILDEPTTGLDPNQILEIRNLIREVSRNKTVIFSTHIMQEVQALCERVVVINKGRIVADSPLQELLRKSGNASFVVVEFDVPVSADELGSLPGVEEASVISPRVFRLKGKPGADIRPEIFRFAADRKLSLVGLKQEERNLENIFRELTQTAVNAS